MNDLRTAQAVLMACKDLLHNQFPMTNGELWTFEDIRMIVHYVDGEQALQEEQRIVHISNETSIYVLTSHLMGVRGVDLDARFTDMLSEKEDFKNAELFLTGVQNGNKFM